MHRIAVRLLRFTKKWAHDLNIDLAISSKAFPDQYLAPQPLRL